MKSKEFIIRKIKDFVKSFSFVRVRYQYDTLSDTHLVEIVPENVKEQDKVIDWESNLIDVLGDEFPTEGICFLSGHSALKIDKAEYTLYGADYSITSQRPVAARIEVGTIEQKPERFTAFSFASKPAMIVGQKYNITGEVGIENEGNKYLLAA